MHARPVAPRPVRGISTRISPKLDRGMIYERNRIASRDVTCNGLFGLGAPEVAVIVGVVALIYGVWLACRVFF